MTAKQAQGEGDLFPLALESPVTPSPESTLIRPKRSITPRGPLFPNLDEAHRNITSRLAFDNPFRKPSGKSQSSTDIHMQALSSPTSEDAFEIPGVMRRHVSEFVSPHPSRPMAGRSLTDRQSIAKLPRKDTAIDIAAAPTITNETKHSPAIKQTQYYDVTGSTVSRIVDQYATASGDSILPSIGDSESAYTFERPSRMSGTLSRLEFPSEEHHVVSKFNNKARRATSPPSQFRLSWNATGAVKSSEIDNAQSANIPESDRVGGLDFPQCRISTFAQSSPSTRTSSFIPSEGIDLNWLKDNRARSNGYSRHESIQGLLPPPLRLLSNQIKRRPASSSENPFSNDADSSEGSGLGDTSTDSNEDPFRYDNEHYRRIRQLGKEREVSCALRRISLSNTQAFLEITSASPRQTIDLNDVNQEDLVQSSHYHEKRSCQGGKFFDPAAFRALHGDAPGDQERDVKIIINKSIKHVEKCEKNNFRSSTFGLSIERSRKKSDHSPNDKATDGDWVTEATSEADLDVIRDPSTKGIKATGSSIADYSDDGYIESFPKFSSREHILQNSSEGLKNYELHSLQDARQTSSLPRPYLSRFNGFGQNTPQFKPNLKESTNSQPIVFNPFCRDYKRADASSFFTYQTNHNGQSKYEFRDSTSTYTPALDSNQAVFETQGTIPSASVASINTAELLDDKGDPFLGHADNFPKQDELPSQNKKRGRRWELAMLNLGTNSQRVHGSVLAGEPDQPTPMTATDYGVTPTSASSKFSFKLLDLSEAQELQKVRSASEMTNKTESTVKYHRSFSESSAHHPGLTPLPHPCTAFVRRKSHVRKGSRLSSTFTPPNWRTPEVDGTPGRSEFTPLDASASRSLITPTTTREGCPDQGWDKSLIGYRTHLLPVDKRPRPKASNRTFENIMNRDIAAVRAAADHSVSYKANSRRQIFFYVMLSLSILPFFALLVLNGNFDNSLAWLTQGEVYRLTKKQRRMIKIVFIIECIIYISLVAAIIVYYVTASRLHH